MGAMILGGGFNVVGDEDDYVGDASPSSHAIARRGGKRGIRVPTPSWMNATTSQGVSRPQEEMDYLPFQSVTIAAGASTGTLLCSPQRPFRGERLLLGALNVTAATSAAQVATIDPAIFVGMVPVGSALGAVPFTVFAAEAFGVRLSFPPVGQGTVIRIPVVLLAVAPAGGITLTGTLIGRAMR